jgi:hypothetical protein
MFEAGHADFKLVPVAGWVRSRGMALPIDAKYVWRTVAREGCVVAYGRANRLASCMQKVALFALHFP